MTVSYINLMKAQQKRHGAPSLVSVPPMSQNDMLAAGRAARARLMGGGMGRLAEPCAPEPIAVPPTPLLPADEPSLPTLAHRAPLNMLQPCSWRFLLALASVRHKVSHKRMLSRERKQDVVDARDEAIALVYQHTRASMPQVGRLFDRDHTTVLHSLRKREATTKLVDLTAGHSPKGPDRPLKPVEMAWEARAARTAEIRDIIKAEYAKATPLRTIAELAGITHGSVKVIAHELGLIHPRGWRAINLVPSRKQAEYRELTAKKLLAADALAILRRGLDREP